MNNFAAGAVGNWAFQGQVEGRVRRRFGADVLEARHDFIPEETIFTILINNERLRSFIRPTEEYFILWRYTSYYFIENKHKQVGSLYCYN